MQRRIEVTGLRKHLRVLAVLLVLCCVPASAWAHSGGDHPLINAAGRGDLSQVKALLAAKANVNIKTRNGDTPLIAATQNGHEVVVQLLKKAGAR